MASRAAAVAVLLAVAAAPLFAAASAHGRGYLGAKSWPPHGSLSSSSSGEAAAADVDDGHTDWKCYSSCMSKCCHRHDDDDDDKANAKANATAGAAAVGLDDDYKCKKQCLGNCFKDVPAVCYRKCVDDWCAKLPPCT
uniref:Bowman-Birk serine protease inhibitors family domain-containing protein n=1 Tax=Oryza glumipatula TaxID=40148 RepID=A0A0D9YB89_9ORYZ